MRIALVCLLLVASTMSRADEGPSLHAKRVRYAGIGVLTLGVIASVVSQVLVAEAKSWEFGNGLGEHYDPTPSWVPIYENAGWGMLAGSQVAIISGIVMIARF